MRLLGASSSAGERAVFVVHAECCQESEAWAVSLRAAQLPAGDSFTRRRSVAPLGASLAFGEIASGRSRARPTEPARSTEQAPRPHARPRKGSRVPTHPLSSCIAARARPSPPRLPRGPALCPGRASRGITSTRLAREPMAGDSGARSAEAETAPLPADLDPRGWTSLGAKVPEGLRRASLSSLSGRRSR